MEHRALRSLSWNRTQRASRELPPLLSVREVFTARPEPQRLRPNRPGTRMHDSRTLAVHLKRSLTCRRAQIRRAVTRSDALSRFGRAKCPDILLMKW